jgi:hypothetical protein
MTILIKPEIWRKTLCTTATRRSSDLTPEEQANVGGEYLPGPAASASYSFTVCA